jgi:hypothetical protein
MNKIKTSIYILALISSVIGLHACGGGGSGSGDTTQGTASKVYSVTVTDIHLVRTAGRQRVPVGPLPVAGAEITVQ